MCVNITVAVLLRANFLRNKVRETVFPRELSVELFFGSQFLLSKLFSFGDWYSVGDSLEKSLSLTGGNFNEMLCLHANAFRNIISYTVLFANNPGSRQPSACK